MLYGRGCARAVTRARRGCARHRGGGRGRRLDPYVRVSLLRLGEGQVPKADDARRTKTVYKTLEPVWDEHFVYEHVDRKSDSTLLLELFYQEYVSADRETAQIVLPVAALPRARPGDTRGEPVDRPWAEHTKNRDVSGALCLSPFFVDGEKTRLCVRVLRATDIKAADMGGTSDAYVKATLRGGVAGVDDQVFRTKVVHKTVAPVWRHDMFFRVRPSTGKEIRAAAGGARRGVLGAVLDGVGERAERAARAVGLGCARGDPGAGASAGTTSSSGRARTRFFRSSRATQFLGGGGDGFKTDVKARGGARARRRSRHDQQSRRLERRRVRVRGERAFEFQTGIFVRGAERRRSDARARPVRPRRGCLRRGRFPRSRVVTAGARPHGFRGWGETNRVDAASS